MGEDIPEPKPEKCDEDCCAKLPSSFGGRITVPEMEPFVGTITQDPLFPCSYGGILEGEFGNTPLFATFCAADSDDLHLASAGPIFAQCGGVIIANNHCSTPASGVSAGECVYAIF